MRSQKNIRNGWIPLSQNKKKTRMVNITINLPEIYDTNIQKLIKQKIVSSRSAAIRLAIRDFLYQEYNNLKLLGCFS